jgi:hypothetical protein
MRRLILPAVRYDARAYFDAHGRWPDEDAG